MFGSKHLATFLLGAAAGAALMKYNSMTPEEQEEFIRKMKEKANALKDEAGQSAEDLREFMNEFREKGFDSLKDYMGKAEDVFRDFFTPKQDTPKAG